MSIDQPVAGTDLDPGLFSGKRRTRRVKRDLPVECVGVGGHVYGGRTTDISRGGMLLGLGCAAFRSATDPSSLMALTLCVSSQFPKGIEVTFGDGAVQAHAEVVRVVMDANAAYPLLVGCRFDPMLDEGQCRLLGVVWDADETAPNSPKYADDVPLPEGLAVDELATRRAGSGQRTNARPSRETPSRSRPEPVTTSAPQPTPYVERATFGVAAHVFPTSMPLGTQRFSGRLVAVGSNGSPDATLLIPVPAGESDPVGWAAGLGAEVRAVLLKDGMMLGEVRGRVTRIEAVSATEARVSIAFEGEVPVSVRSALG